MSTPSDPPAPTPPAPRPADRWVAVWLFVIAALVFAMVVVGGLTRLTDSGLSITEWKPVTGAIPPLGDAAWAEEFAKYRDSPEYQFQNRGMSLPEFKVIYWWEWGHRQLGRVLGLAFAVPLAAFWLAGAIRPHLRLRLLAILALGGLQGAIGWWMVASGLVDRVDVSQHRLAVHLLMAFALLGAVWWTALDAAAGPPRRGRADALTGLAAAFAVLVFAQVGLGALVAGLDAGRIHTTWPLMDGRWAPLDYFALEPWWRNVTDTHAAVQFNHRMMGYAVVLAALALAAAAARVPARGVRATGLALGGLACLQAAGGVVTLVHAAPLALSALHQAGAALLFVAAVTLVRSSALTSTRAAPRASPPRHRPAPAP